MKYDLTIAKDRHDFINRTSVLIHEGVKVELTKTRAKRSIKANAYLHVVFTLWAINYGDTLDEAKTDLKRDYGLTYIKPNGKKYLGKTSKMNTKELTTFIDWIRNRASKKGGFYIPTSEEYLINQFNIDKEIQQHKEYL